MERAFVRSHRRIRIPARGRVYSENEGNFCKLEPGVVGGTKTLLALYEARGAELRPVRAASLPSRDFSTLEDTVACFLAESLRGAIEAACFGAAGPVVNGPGRSTSERSPRAFPRRESGG